MTLRSRPLPPSSSLPPLATLDRLSEEQLVATLDGLSAIYSPLRGSLAIRLNQPTTKNVLRDLAVATPPLQGDSGYASDEDGGGSEEDNSDFLTALRADVHERRIAERWLTSLIGRVQQDGALPQLGDDDARQRIVDLASCVLESFFAGPPDGEAGGDQEAGGGGFVREFSFDLSQPFSWDEEPIRVRLNDGLAGMDSDDHEDVGLQSWGGAVVLSNLLCADPSRFGLGDLTANNNTSRIIELGAGTGLVSLVLAKMLPRLGRSKTAVIATDYHPAVLQNLRSNVVANFSQDKEPVQIALLDWSAPSLEPPLDVPADMLIATDVVYAPEHAEWLRDCASRLLRPGGAFWLLVTVRHSGRFQGISDTVEVAFASEARPRNVDGRRLTVVESQAIEKRRGVGRGDESGYKLLRIEWA